MRNPLAGAMRNPFQYQAPTDKQKAVLVRIQNRVRDLYETLEEILPESVERAQAILKLREVRMWANNAVVFTPDAELTDP